MKRMHVSVDFDVFMILSLDFAQTWVVRVILDIKKHWDTFHEKKMNHYKSAHN